LWNTADALPRTWHWCQLCLVDLEHALDFNRKIVRQTRAASDKPRMPPTLAKYCDEQIGSSIHDECVLIEFSRGVHESAKTQTLPDAVEIAIAGDLQLYDKVEQNKLGCFLALLERKMLTEASLKPEFIAPERTLNANHEIA
jgi:hypothetical protein